MGVEATIIIQFGESVDAETAFVVAELDETLNTYVDDDGETKVKTTFQMEDTPWFWIHMQPGLRITRYDSTDGHLNYAGSKRPSRTQRILFTRNDGSSEAKHTFGYYPYGGYSYEFLGDTSSISASGRDLQATGKVPVLVDVTANLEAYSFQLIPPSKTLEEDETYQIACVIYVDEG